MEGKPAKGSARISLYQAGFIFSCMDRHRLRNIWRFPFLAGRNGGGAFVLFYLICVLL